MSRASSYLRLVLAFLAATLPLGAACGGDDDDGGSTVDAGAVDAAPGACVASDQLPLEYRPITMVSTGTVDATVTDGVTTAIVDARAGGIIAAGDNPYIYIDLEAGVKAEIDDVDAFSSSTWDVALKRSSLRSNGGDSGMGGVEVATVAAATLADVTAAPADSEFTTDDWVDDNCQFVSLPLGFGEPMSAFGEWYNYDQATHIVSPKPQVYVVRTRSGSLLKFQIETYYADDAGLESALYRVAWAPL